jgi:hypothetical protein
VDGFRDARMPVPVTVRVDMAFAVLVLMVVLMLVGVHGAVVVPMEPTHVQTCSQ